MNYTEFLDKKQLHHQNSGFESDLNLNPALFDFQKDVVKWALQKGKACLFQDCGMGKTIQQLEWARHVQHYTQKPILILAPIAVAEQTVAEGQKFGIDVTLCTSQKDVQKGINITNYEKLHKFKTADFGGIVLDESSILKSMSGHYRNLIIDSFKNTPYKLACTATPSPNDYMELGNHAEFLNVMSYSEMLSMFFVNDMSDTKKWRLKKHAKEREFWKWICSWAVMMATPSDLGYEEPGFDLPKLTYHEEIVKALKKKNLEYGFFATQAQTMSERRTVRRESIQARCERAAEIVNDSNDQWVIWCGLNAESQLLTSLINEATEITGSQKQDWRADKMLGFAKRDVKRIVTKPSIAGFGMNWQNCNKMIFVGLSDSWEQLYQATRRIWRFGQTKPVDAYIVIEEREGKVLENIKRKDQQAKHMLASMIKHTQDISKEELHKNSKKQIKWYEKTMELPEWINKN